MIGILVEASARNPSKFIEIVKSSWEKPKTRSKMGDEKARESQIYHLTLWGTYLEDSAKFVRQMRVAQYFEQF